MRVGRDMSASCRWPGCRRLERPDSAARAADRPAVAAGRHARLRGDTTTRLTSSIICQGRISSGPKALSGTFRASACSASAARLRTSPLSRASAGLGHQAAGFGFRIRHRHGQSLRLGIGGRTPAIAAEAAIAAGAASGRCRAGWQPADCFPPASCTGNSCRACGRAGMRAARRRAAAAARRPDRYRSAARYRAKPGCGGRHEAGSDRCRPASSSSATLSAANLRSGRTWRGIAAAFCQAARAASLSPAASAWRASLSSAAGPRLVAVRMLVGRVRAADWPRRLSPALGSAGTGLALPGIRRRSDGEPRSRAVPRPRLAALFGQQLAELVGRIDEPRRQRIVFDAQLLGLADQRLPPWRSRPP